MNTVLIIGGSLLIIAIIAHGMWTIRKNEKRQREQVDAIANKRRQVDSGGFDDDGVGAVRVIASASASANKSKTTAPTSGAKAHPSEANKPAQTNETTPTVTQSAAVVATAAEDAAIPAVASDSSAIRATDDGLPDELPLAPIRAEHDDLFARGQQPASSVADKATAAVKKNRDSAPAETPQSMELPLQHSEQEPVLTEEPEEVIVLHVVGHIEGSVLLQQMTELGFKYGDFDIFHRHVDTAGTGPVLFSLANMYNPGTFNIDTIETFTTGGVALFLALPIKSNSMTAFTMMHNAAVKLAAAIDQGQVLDEHRNPLTRQATQHIHQRIREFERKRLISGKA